MKSRFFKNIEKRIRTSATKSIIGILFGIIIGILLTPAISPILALIYHPVDNEPPQISNIYPYDNSYAYGLESISANVIDHGGSGIDFENSCVNLTSSLNSNIKGNYSHNGSKILFTPSNKLPPDVYTTTFVVYDKAKRVQEKSTRFVILEDTKFNIDISEYHQMFIDGDDIYGLIWEDGYLQFKFIIENTCSNTAYENVELMLNFPGTVLNYVIDYDKGCQNPELRNSYSQIMYLENGKTNTNISMDSIAIEIDKIYPQGILGGTVFVDPYYETNGNGLVVFSDNTGEYYGKYTHTQFGRIFTEDIYGLINASPTFYLEKGIFIKNQAINTSFYDRLIPSINHFDKAINLGLNDSEVWIEKGECNLYLGNFSEAFLCFNEAIEIKNDSRAYYDLGILFFKLGNFEKSSYYCKKALSIDNDDQLAKSLLEKSTNASLFGFPENVPISGLESMNDREGTIYFTTDTQQLFSNPHDQILFCDFNINNTRFICSRGPNYQLLFMVLDLESGIHLARMDLTNISFTDEKTGVFLLYSEENLPQLVMYNGIEETLEQASLNRCVLTNPLEQDTGLEISFEPAVGYPMTYYQIG